MANPGLEIFLLGGLTIKLAGGLVTGLEFRKAEALLAYLAGARRPVPRELLADLFWQDRSQAAALGNLRVVLTNLRQTLGAYLTITRQTVELKPDSFWLDAHDLEQKITAAKALLSANHPLSRNAATDIAAALGQYQGDFLQGVFIREAPGFDEWAVVERERLRRLAEDAHHDLIDFYLNTGEYRAGIEWAGRLLALDPLRESAHRQLMLLLARDGQTAAALTQYEACTRILAAELGLEPDSETQALYLRLKQAGGAYRHNLPAQTTPFIGREPELARLAQLLADPACRLICLTGPGGIGKTRLALQAAVERIGAFLNGVWFLPLSGMSGGEGVVLAALAEALHLSLTGTVDLKAALFHYLQDKELLIVADNFEQLVDSAGLLSALLSQCSHVKILVTSRERLNLSGETLVEVGGLSVPPESAAHLEDYSAAQLFLQSARRLVPQLTASEWVSRICQLVDGLPLGIELAATWVRVMPPEEIAHEIERDLGFLAAPLRDVPERHRSLRAVFEHSWQLLGSEEQILFSRLSVFQGGFTREAALQVTAATAQNLLTLMDQSLVQSAPGGRCDMHPLVRQFAAEKVGEATAMRQRHSAYYIDWLGQHHQNLQGPKQIEALAAIASEIENLRQAWQWLVERTEQQVEVADTLPRLEAALKGLAEFYTIRCWYEEFQEVTARTAAALTALPPTAQIEMMVAQALYQEGKSCYYNATADKAQALFEKSLAIYRRLGARGEQAEPLYGLGYLAMRAGDYAEAQTLLSEGLALARQSNQLSVMAALVNVLAEVADHQGNFALAKACDEEHVLLQRQLGNPRGLARALCGVAISFLREDAFAQAELAAAEAADLYTQVNDVMGLATAYSTRGNAAQYLELYPEAETYYRESMRLCREASDFWGEALGFHNLGELAAAQRQYGLAKQLYEESIVIYARHDIKSGQMNALADLAHACLELGDYAPARDYLQQSIQLSQDAGEVPMTLKALAAWAALLARTGQPGLSAELVRLVAAHPATEETARKWLGPIRAELGLGVMLSPASTLTLEEALQRVTQV